MGEGSERFEQMRARLRRPSPDEVKGLQRNSEAVRPKLIAYVRQIAEGMDDPYDTAFELYRAAMTSVAPEGREGAQAYGLYMLWGALTERVETKPDEREAAFRDMHRAAGEWLRVCDADEAEWRSYFDHWLYEEVGYRRGSRALVANRQIGDVTPAEPPEGSGRASEPNED